MAIFNSYVSLPEGKNNEQMGRTPGLRHGLSISFRQLIVGGLLGMIPSCSFFSMFPDVLGNDKQQHTRPGKHTKTMERSTHFSWENSLFLWPCSIAMINYQRVTTKKKLRTNTQTLHNGKPMDNAMGIQPTIAHIETLEGRPHLLLGRRRPKWPRQT